MLMHDATAAGQLTTQGACGRSFFVSHALSCHMGGYASIRHNEI